jgi:hypothetical protein
MSKKSKAKKARTARKARVKKPSDYKKGVIAALKKAAGGLSQSHLLPRAYCLAKPGGHCAVFAVPPQDREPQVATDGCVMVQNESALPCQPGQWYSLAYVVNEHCSGLRVVDLDPKKKKS